MIAAVESAETFDHLVLDGIFPDAAYREMIRLLPDAAGFRALTGAAG